MTRRFISFTSDFGESDGYVGAVKGVILSICPDAILTDISHSVPPQDIAHAAFVLYTAARFYPKGTIHLVVVDPEVGSDRRAICVKSNGHFFVGPDNGVFTPFLLDASAVYQLTDDNYWRDEIHPTFHGRDIFGPVAAHLAAGLNLDKLGPVIKDPVHLENWIKRSEGSMVEGAVVHIDHFGNCITSLHPEDAVALENFTIWMPDCSTAPEADKICTTYAATPLGEPCWLVGSAGLVELAVNGGNAAKDFGIERGDRVLIEKR